MKTLVVIHGLNGGKMEVRVSKHIVIFFRSLLFPNMISGLISKFLASTHDSEARRVAKPISSHL